MRGGNWAQAHPGIVQNRRSFLVQLFCSRANKKEDPEQNPRQSLLCSPAACPLFFCCFAHGLTSRICSVKMFGLLDKDI
ncbi:hypothetical protein L6452_37653 [Arctium lappa]|uniref:Uncharacterized protein n=1 Tax=Arctium lappa TaxID=4217 RepID=A0ACB8Y437_ARCLA|nr:hypothetical protein L6452_37653 [Arctium lappa]